MFMRIVFTLTNRVDPDEMQHSSAFHLGLHYLSNYPFRDFQYTKGQKRHVLQEDMFFKRKLQLVTDINMT